MTDEHMTRMMIQCQQAEITEYHIYHRLAAIADSKHNREILENIAADELRHYRALEAETGAEVKASRWKVCFYYWMARILGLTFSLRLMEYGRTWPEKLPHCRRRPALSERNRAGGV